MRFVAADRRTAADAPLDAEGSDTGTALSFTRATHFARQARP